MAKRIRSKKKKNQTDWRKFLFYFFVLIAAFAVWASISEKTNTTPEEDTVIEDTATIDGIDCSIDALQMAHVADGTKEQVVDYHGFKVSFNADFKQPNWVAWELTREECLANDADKKQATFMPDTRVKGCASLEDYRGSGFDRGHMCPAADMKWDQKAMNACYYLTNMCPQTHALNGGAWKTLEEKCRAWADRDSAIVIICGPILTDYLPRTIGDGLKVPERFFKVVLAPYANPPRGIGFIMPNSQVTGGIMNSAVSIDEIEEATGIDFFSALPDNIENDLEAQCNFPRWNQKKKKKK